MSFLAILFPLKVIFFSVNVLFLVIAKVSGKVISSLVPLTF